MGLLGQDAIGKLFDSCGQDSVAIEEVLSAYLAAKFLKGYSADAVSVKLRYLTLYLRGSGRQQILQTGSEVFKVLSTEVSEGGSRIGVCPATTAPGREAWNALRKSKYQDRLTTHHYGGPGGVGEALAPTRSQEAALPQASGDQLQERYFANRFKLNAPPPLYEPQPVDPSAALPLYEASRSSRRETSTSASTSVMGCGACAGPF